MRTDIYINTVNGEVFQDAELSLPVTRLTGRRRCPLTIRCRFVDPDTLDVQELASSPVGIFGVKALRSFEGSYILSDTAWTKVGTGTATYYDFSVDTTTAGGDAQLRYNGIAGDDERYVDLWCEVRFGVNSPYERTPTIRFRLSGNIIEGTEDAPELNLQNFVYQSGTASLASGAKLVSVTFSESFNTTPVFVRVTVYTPAGSPNLDATVQKASITTSGFTFDLTATTPNANYSYAYFAI